jgi:hypothetical protein
MAEIKTKATGANVEAFLKRAAGKRMEDCRTLVAMYSKATRAKPKMWGPSIIGFGSCKYRYPDGREIDWMLGAFSPRKTCTSWVRSPGRRSCWPRSGSTEWESRACTSSGSPTSMSRCCGG